VDVRSDRRDRLGDTRDIRYVEISPEECATVLARILLPPEFVGLVTYPSRKYSMAATPRSAGLRRDFAKYVRETAAKGVWNTDRQRRK